MKYKGNALADFCAKSTRTETTKTCNLNELRKFDPSQTACLGNTQYCAPEDEMQNWY